MNVVSFFDGMSCGQLALQRAGFEIENYYAYEIDKYAMQVTQKNFPNTKQMGSVTEAKGIDLLKCDLFIGGSPCQGFSFAGKQLNFEDTRSKLFFEYVRMLKELREINPEIKFLLENVKMKKEYQDVISFYLGCEPIEINSKLLSAQKRSRLYWTNIDNISIPADKEILLKDVMLDSTDDSINFKYPTAKRLAYIQRKIDKGWLKKAFNTVETDKSECLLASMYKQMQEFIWSDKNGLRFFHINEIEALQTVPKNYTDVASNSQRLKMIGNGWTVDVIAHIFKNLK